MGMSTAYVTLSQVKQALRSSYTGADDTVLTALITPVSAFIDNYCNRANGGFLTQSYDELYHGTGDNLLFLNNTPVQSIQSIRTIEQPALYIRNNDSDMGARALVQINGTPVNDVNLNSQYTSTGITLTYIKNAVITTNTLTWVSYPTVNALVAAINGLGNDWQAGVMGGFGGWSTTDLRATQGAFGVRIVTGYLFIHSFDLPVWRLDENMGEIYSQMGFARGVFNWRVNYTAGYTTLPEDLAQVVCELVVNAYYQTEISSSLTSENLGPTGYTQYATKLFDGLSILARNTINRYKIRKVNKASQW